MRIINIVESSGGNVVCVHSFPIIENESVPEVLENVHQTFIRLLKEYDGENIEEEDMEYCYEQGMYWDNNAYELVVKWSHIHYTK